MSTKRMREIARMAEDIGIEDATICHGKKHPKLRGRIGRRRITSPVPASPSDHRTLANLRAFWRRMIREHQ